MNKREIKSKIKEEMHPPSDDSVPLTLNYYKFLLEEKKQNILQFAKVKLADQDFAIFRAIITKCDSNVNYKFKNSQ